jgi:hypothetical protein
VGPTSVVVVFRIPLPAIGHGGEGAYLSRARLLCARGEALGGRLVAWSATLVGLAWDLDGVEEAIELVTGLRSECPAPEQAWACGIAEGEIEPLSLEGQRMHLAWGLPLLVASSLARIAKAGEALVDGDVSCVRSGRLALVASRSASDGGRRVRGWEIDLDRPWAPPIADPSEPDTVDDLPREELASADIIELTENAEERPAEDLAHRDRESTQTVAPRPSERCRASLSLAMALSAAARPQDALMEALDALARAKEARSPDGLAACYALLAKLYASVGKADAAGELRELAARPPAAVFRGAPR